jgi:hypothetical protein
LSNQTLRLYYQMASFCRSYLPPPPLEITWKAILAEIDGLLATTGNGESIEDSSAFENMVEFVKIMRTQEPRFLRHVDFPKCVSERINKFQEICARDSETEREFIARDEDLYELYNNESRRLEALADVSEKLFDLDIELELDPELSEVVESLRGAAASYASRGEDYLVPEPDYEGGRMQTEEISVGALFSDL